MKGNVETYRRQEHGEIIPQLFEVAEKLGGVVSFCGKLEIEWDTKRAW